jgi:hypothetical protein
MSRIPAVTELTVIYHDIACPINYDFSIAELKRKSMAQCIGLPQLLLQIVNGRPFAARVEFVADKDQIALLNAP